MIEKIGVFGGSFNPIHNGHINLIKESLVKFNLSKILCVPTKNTYYKEDNIILPFHRINMIEMAILENDLKDRVFVSDVDIKRESTTYTVDTIKDIRKIYKNEPLFFIIGYDSFLTIDKWKNASVFLKDINLVVANRRVERDEKNQSEILEKMGAKLHFLNNKNIDISSSMIRNKIKNKEEIKGLLPDTVLEYILKNNLYG